MAIVPNGWRCTAQGTLQGQRFVNVFWYRKSPPGTESDVDESLVADQIKNNIIPALADAQSADVDWDLVTTQLYLAAGPFATKEWPTVQPGTLAGNAMPSEVTMNIKKKTAFAGRSERGRWYFAGAPQGALNSVTGRWEIAVTGPLAIATVALTNSIAGDAPGSLLIPVLYRTKSGTFRDLTTADVDNIPRCQRRRQIGRGI